MFLHGVALQDDQGTLDRVGTEIRQGRSGRFGQFVRPCIARGLALQRSSEHQIRTLEQLKEGGGSTGQTWILL